MTQKTNNCQCSGNAGGTNDPDFDGCLCENCHGEDVALVVYKLTRQGQRLAAILCLKCYESSGLPLEMP
jgi:hypothetical protein